jgi:hypothetical protein
VFISDKEFASQVAHWMLLSLLLPFHLHLCDSGCNNAGGLSGERARPRIRCQHHRESGLPDRKVLCS